MRRGDLGADDSGGPAVSMLAVSASIVPAENGAPGNGSILPGLFFLHRVYQARLPVMSCPLGRILPA